LLVPAQDGGWCDQKSAAAASGQQSGEGGDDGAVGPVDPWSGCASLQHGQLMAQDEDLDLVGGVGAGVEHHPAQQLREHLVDQFDRHRRIML
jgi:hypothetical protein